MRTITRTILTALTLLAAQIVTAPAQAHLTEPVHAEWTAGFTDEAEIRVATPGGYFQTDNFFGRYRDDEPFQYGIKIAPRTYDFTFPAGFIINHTYLSGGGYPGDCTVTNNTVHCESGIDFVEAIHDDFLGLAKETGQLPDGVYQISMTSTMTVISPTTGEVLETYTDTDTMPIEIRKQRTSDLATTGPSDKQALRPRVPVKYNVHVRNFGPDTARDVAVSINSFYGPEASIATDTSGCVTYGDAVRCSWTTLSPGESKTIEIAVTAADFAFEVLLDGSVSSWEIDPKINNDRWTFRGRVR